MTPSFDFYDKPGYFAELTRCANTAGKGDKLILMAMSYDANIPEVATMIKALSQAAKRGAKVQLIIDAMTFILDDKEWLGPMFTRGKIVPEKLHGSFRQTYKTLEQLRANGGQYFIINRPEHAFMWPYGGRSHIKLAIVNDRFFIGGCNFDDTNYLDVMAVWQNRPTVDAMTVLLEKIIEEGSVRDALEDTDQTLVLGKMMNIYIDCGVKRQSTILRQAHTLIDDAKESIIITCQYFPGEDTARHLLAAHKRGVNVKIYYSHPSAHGQAFFVHHLYNLRERLSMPSSFFEHRLAKDIPKLHSKVIITEAAAMIGSHNYVVAGVKYGTAEIALLNHEPGFIAGLKAHIEDLVKR